jgi:hypothetical protein
MCIIDIPLHIIYIPLHIIDIPLHIVNIAGNLWVLLAIPVPVPVPVNYPYLHGGYGFACGSVFLYPRYTHTRTHGR